MSELLSAGLHTKFDRMSGFSTREQADLAQQTADDFGYRASAALFGIQLIDLTRAAYRLEIRSWRRS
jgi:hypothetical protein